MHPFWITYVGYWAYGIFTNRAATLFLEKIIERVRNSAFMKTERGNPEEGGDPANQKSAAPDLQSVIQEEVCP